MLSLQAAEKKILSLLLAISLTIPSGFAQALEIDGKNDANPIGSTIPAKKIPLTTTEVEAQVDTFIKGLRGKAKTAAAQHPELRTQLIRYFNFLHLTGEKAAKDVRADLAESSMQFLFCPPEDWVCLEKYPVIPIANPMRDDVKPNLGAPVVLNEPLRMEYFLTQRWAQRMRKQAETSPTVAEIFGQKIKENAKDKLFLALYGIDEAEGSMKPVFDAITEVFEKGVDVRAVVDVTDEGAPNSFLRDYDVVVKANGTAEIVKYKLTDIDFSYTNPKNPSKWAWGRPEWMDQIQSLDPKVFGKESAEARDAAWIVKQPGGKTAMRLAFQYKDTPRLLRILNADISKNTQARGRLEFPMGEIMHNKFAVMRTGNQMSVWSGTTNVSDTCMGSEDNSNIAVLIKNNAVAQAFLDEFKEMFNYDPKNTKLKEKAPTLVTGRFSKEKRPNTQRYFKFNDGHEMRVHFSPTDDGEHRAILPFIHSAKPGDTLRISMFGSGGLEAVRALQRAQSRGVVIKIVLDNMTGSGNYSWIKHADGNLFDGNPYPAVMGDVAPVVDMDIRLNAWPGLNHHKTATLTKPDGRVEQMIIGSQNWSQQGNNANDENMITIRRVGKSIEAGEAFNKQFDESMIPLSRKLSMNTETQTLERLPLEASALQ
jgi:phosphatidylserine/phosphatidylglycerophosphate/cardiolipin synthase-like enzyme